VLRPAAGPAPEDPARESCPLGQCDGSGWLIDEGTDTARPCDCRERRVGQALTRRLDGGIPKRFRGVSFDRKPVCDLDPYVLRHVRGFVQRIDEHLDAGQGLWFHGDVGTGKTSLAMLVAKTALDRGRTVAVYPVPRLLAAIRQTYGDEGGDSYATLFRRLVTVDLLVLDDLGAERQTEWVLEQLYVLVNERWQDQRSVVVTTNTAAPDTADARSELRVEIDALRRAREGGSADRLADVVGRLERLADRLADLEAAGGADPVARLRDQVGARTVSRLIEMCDDGEAGGPIPIMGPDLRMAAGGP
jgi:DNA replication protein DnaC